MTEDEKLERIGLKIEDLSIEIENVFARSTGERRFLIRSLPAFIYGLAYGDEIELLDESGAFKVIKRNGQIAIRVFITGTLSRPEVEKVVDQVSALEGLHENAKNAKKDDGASLLLLSLPVSVGFPKIERYMRELEAIGAKWEYGNVYARDGTPLGWW